MAVGARGATPELKELMNEYDVEHFAVDLGDPRGPERLVAAVAASYGSLDLLVNNVGADSEPATTSLDFTDEQWQRIFELNFFGVVRTVRAAAPLLAAGTEAAVANIASLNARLPQGMIAPYSAAKAALVNFGKAISEELAPQGCGSTRSCPARCVRRCGRTRAGSRTCSGSRPASAPRT